MCFCRAAWALSQGGVIALNWENEWEFPGHCYTSIGNQLTDWEMCDSNGLKVERRGLDFPSRPNRFSSRDYTKGIHWCRHSNMYNTINVRSLGVTLSKPNHVQFD
jgi:hypothetical protein